MELTSLPHAHAHTSTPRPYRTRETSNNPFLDAMPVPYVHPYSFQDAATTIISEAAQMLNEGCSPGPGSEYVNVSNPSHSSNSDTGIGSINPEMGLRRTKNNPSGTYCTSPGCVPKKRSNHDGPHCYSEGGGMEGQAPWQKKNKKGKEKGAAGEQTAQLAATSCHSGTGDSHTASAAPKPEGIATVVSDSSHFQNLSCAVITPGAKHSYLLGRGPSCTILDSGTTSHLICDWSLFWTYTPDDSMRMTTANHGTLNTIGCGDCLAVLSIGGWSVHIHTSQRFPLHPRCHDQSVVRGAHGTQGVGD